MLTKRQFITNYNRIRNSKRLRTLTNESIGNLYDAAVTTKPFFKEKFGRELSCTYTVETDRQIDNSDGFIPLIGAGYESEFPRLSTRARTKLQEHVGITYNQCRDKIQPDGRRTLRLVNRAVEREVRNRNQYGGLSEAYYDLNTFRYRLERYFENVAVNFARDSYDLTISADPIDFLHLGHNDCDQGSCFGGISSHGLARLRLPTVTNSFVAILRNPDNGRALARCWGFYSIRNKTWHVTNFYVREISKQAFAYLLSIVFDEIVGEEHVQIKRMQIASGRGVYNNRDGCVFSTSKTPDRRRSARMTYPNRLELTELDNRGNPRRRPLVVG